jgi:hypothetical protein
MGFNQLKRSGLSLDSYIAHKSRRKPTWLVPKIMFFTHGKDSSN